MNARTILVSSAVLGLLVASDAAAQKLTLRVEQGLVTLDAENVTIDEVLARWTSITGLNVVSKNGGGSDIPITVHVEGMPERQALALVLRDLSGYIMGERRDPRTGLVTIDRVLILPDSAAQAAANATPAVPRRVTPFGRLATPAAPVVDLTEAPELAPQPSDPDPVELAPAPAPQERPLTSTPTSPFGNSRGAGRPGEMTPPLLVEPPPIRTSDGPPPGAVLQPPPPESSAEPEP